MRYMTKNELSEIIKNVTRKVLIENFILHEDELMEYARLRKSETGLDFDIFVDDGGAYKRYHYPLRLYARDGYTNDAQVFPVNITQNPIIPERNYNLSDIDLNALVIFIQQNYNLLVKFSNGEIEHGEFYNACKPVIYSFASNELNEMSTLKPKQSGLPTVLWIDEGTNPKHGPRIKFQASDEQVLTTQFTSMSISQNPQIFNLPANCNLSSKEINRITEFVKVNEINLLNVANGTMTYREFLNDMVKV